MSLLTNTSEKVPFEQKWGPVRAVVSKMLGQLNVTKAEWQDTFWLVAYSSRALVRLLPMLKRLLLYRTVHALCQWDDSGPDKVKKHLKDEIESFIAEAQEVSMHVDPDKIYLCCVRSRQSGC